MREQTLFHIVFLCQILLVSFYYPQKVLGRMKHVFETYPPSSYPKLYPKPVEHYVTAQRNYKMMNHAIVIIGLVILATLFTYPRSGDWDHVIAMGYYLLQFVPILILDLSALSGFKLMRDAASRTTRKADLRPRGLFDYVSHTYVGLAVLAFVLLTALVMFFNKHPFEGYGGYANIAILAVANIAFAITIYFKIYGKRKDPYETEEDRQNQVQSLVKILIFISMAVSIFASLGLILAGLELREYQAVLHSIYYQILAIVCTQPYYKIGKRNFEVYRKDSVTT